jgi:hypothetical protein
MGDYVGSKTTCGSASLDFPATSGTPAGDCPGLRAGGDLLRGVTGVDLPGWPGYRHSRQGSPPGRTRREGGAGPLLAPPALRDP